MHHLLSNTSFKPAAFDSELGWLANRVSPIDKGSCRER